MTTQIDYAADGLAMRGRLFAPAGDGADGGAAVLIFPDAFGPGDHALAQARRLTALGHTALVCDLHGEGRVVTDFDEAIGLIEALAAEPERMRARGGAALDALRAQPGVDAQRTVAIGYCFGGAMALELARSGAELAAAVGFHSTLATRKADDAHKIRGRVLVCMGADDPYVDAAQRAAFEDEMRRGGARWRMSLYGGVVHSFTDPGIDRLGNPGLARYDAEADRLSWTELQGVLGEVAGAARATPRPQSH